MGLKLLLKAWFIEIIQSNWILLRNVESSFICKAICLFMQIASAKSRSVMGASHQPAFIVNCLTISLTCLPCLRSRWASPCALSLLMIGLNSASVDVFYP